MRVLNGLRKQYNISREMQEYIKRYKIIYKRVIKEAKRRDNEKYVLRANNKTKVMWHVINKEVGKSWKYDKKIELNDRTQIISNPQNVAGMLNTFFVEIIDNLFNQNSSTMNDQSPKQRINCCSKTIFLYLVTEYEIECVSESLKAHFLQVMMKFWNIL
jgi:hypothetical protein